VSSAVNWVGRSAVKSAPGGAVAAESEVQMVAAPARAADQLGAAPLVVLAAAPAPVVEPVPEQVLAVAPAPVPAMEEPAMVLWAGSAPTRVLPASRAAQTEQTVGQTVGQLAAAVVSAVRLAMTAQLGSIPHHAR
jgi:hypothetical protein